MIPSNAAIGRSRRYARVHLPCRREKESSAFGEHRMEKTEIQTVISPHFRPRIFPSPFPPLPRPRSLLVPPPFRRQPVDRLSNPLADPPKWNALEKYQPKITADQFERLLRDVYANHGISDELIRLEPDFACILMDRDAQRGLRFALPNRSDTPALGPQLADGAIIPRKKRTGVLPG